MKMSGDAGTSSFAQVHPKVDTIRTIDLAKNPFYALAKYHHFRRRLGRKFTQLIQVSIRHDHDVAICVRKCIKNDVAMGSAMNDSRRMVIVSLDRVAEDAPDGLVCRADVGIAPRRPEVIHAQAG